MPGNESVSEFEMLINNFFDTFNSYQESNKNNQFKSAYQGRVEQTLLLNQAFTEISMLRIGKKEKQGKLLPFQIGILQSIRGLQALYEYAKEKFEVRYIMTYKLTQDALENFFAQVRALGRWYDNPTPMEFIYRFRLLIFSKNLDNIRFSKYIERDRIEENFLSSDLININQNSSVSYITPAKLGILHFQALYYLAGYVAIKCRKYPLCAYALGESTSTISQHIPPEALWLLKINRGRVSHPSPLFGLKFKY